MLYGKLENFIRLLPCLLYLASFFLYKNSDVKLETSSKVILPRLFLFCSPDQKVTTARLFNEDK